MSFHPGQPDLASVLRGTFTEDQLLIQGNAMKRTLIGAAIALTGVITVGAASAQVVNSSADGRSVIITPVANQRAAQPSAVQVANAKSRLPMLKDISQVPGYGGPRTQAYGTLSHPFTTKGAYANKIQGAPTNLFPYRTTGKLYMQFGSSLFVCTASVINKGLLVTAAHCIQNYGDGASGAATRVYFQPARHGSVAPHTLRFGQWEATSWIVPSVYFNGTDTCTTTGVVCENDIAIVTMATGPSPHTGKEIAQVVGRYGVYTNNAGYTNFLGEMATQITQLGYPAAFDSGLKMIRTDSMGYQAAPKNVIIGSAQTGGSSGGPWLMNFGQDPVTSTSTPSFSLRNRVVAVTSWGYVSDTLKVQGASRFSHNNAFPAPGPTNFKSLLDTACAAAPTKCS